MQAQKNTSPQLPSMFTAALIREVQAQIDHANATGQLTTAWEAIQEMLLTAGVAQKNLQIKAEFMGVSQHNRSKLGVGGSEAQVHGAEILQEGCSHKKASDGTSVEVAPPLHDEGENNFNAS